MEVEFLDKFYKDLNSISSRSVKNSLRRLIEEVESASHLFEIANTKKLKGHKSAYRFRIGDYRVGVFYEGQKITFARVVHRKDIYSVFP